MPPLNAQLLKSWLFSFFFSFFFILLLFYFTEIDGKPRQTCRWRIPKPRRSTKKSTWPIDLKTAVIFLSSGTAESDQQIQSYSGECLDARVARFPDITCVFLMNVELCNWCWPKPCKSPSGHIDSDVDSPGGG